VPESQSFSMPCALHDHVQERFYFSDQVQPAFVSSAPLMLSRLQTLMHGQEPAGAEGGPGQLHRSDGHAEGHIGMH